MMKRDDRRVQRSKEALRVALLELMTEKGFYETSVSDITEGANVGRSTFYAHFADKEDLLQQSLHEGLKQHLLLAIAENPPRDDVHPALQFSRPMLQHIQQQMPLLTAMAAKGTHLLVLDYLSVMLRDLVQEELSSIRDAEERRWTAYFVVGAFTGVLSRWLEDVDAATVDEVDALFVVQATRGLTGAR